MVVKWNNGGTVVENYKRIDTKIKEGYTLLRKDKTIKACDIWLEAWEDIKAVMAENKIKDLPALQEKYRWTEFAMNFVQDLDDALYNAAIEEPQYFTKRIRYCEELLELCGKEDELTIENTRRSIAESHYALGNKQECDRLFQKWLADDPTWGWGYIGWADCYQYGIPADNIKAEEIISSALRIENLRDRADVVERAIEIYTALGNNQQAAELKNELEKGQAKANPQVTVTKIGRNEPCPCGSGKKYKKCCGKQL
jgi:tetratricopeptide (TPR) repeat protein